MNTNNILILGATGMLGHALFTDFCDAGLEVAGTSRSRDNLAEWFGEDRAGRIINPVEAENFGTVEQALKKSDANTVINCIGIVKQLPEAENPLKSIYVNALFPHKLAEACRSTGARLIQISTDCVFSGDKGNYGEEDESDARDLYGRTKFLGELRDSGALTLRTSIIGHELQNGHGLIEWFVNQEESVHGYRRAVFSGLPTVETARIFREYILPDRSLKGLFHVSAEPISKYELLKMTAEIYEKDIRIEPDDEVVLDRSLDSAPFRKKTGYRPPLWPKLVRSMYDDYLSKPVYRRSGGV